MSALVRCSVRGRRALLPTVVRYVPIDDKGEQYREERETDWDALRTHLRVAHAGAVPAIR